MVRCDTLRGCGVLMILAVALSILTPACTDDKKVDVARKLNPATMATMTTYNVSTLISDSGVIQYKIVSPEWKAYELGDTPYWTFPKGLYLQKFDRFFHVVATVAADSAKYFKRQNLWRLDGNVELTKVPKDLFMSQQLFWDQRRGEIYSDSFIHIETATHVLEGMGFRSNDNLTVYRVVKPQGIFPVNQQNLKP